MNARWLSVALVLLGTAAMAAEPATQPSKNAGAVVVFPFGGLGDTGRYGWIGQAIQTSLVADIGRLRGAQPIVGERPPGDVQGAIHIARDSGAQFAILGTFQVLDNDVRITGQVVDVSNGRVVGAIKSTGALRDLFQVEDTVADQVRRTIESRTGATEVVVAAPPTSLPPQTAAAVARPYPWDARPSYAAERESLRERYRYENPNYSFGPFPYGWGWDYGGGSFGSVGSGFIFTVPVGTTVTGVAPAPVQVITPIVGGNTPGAVRGGNSFIGTPGGGNFVRPTPGGNSLQPVNTRAANR